MSELSESEAVEMMQENFVGQRVEIPKTHSDNTFTCEITAARVQNGVPELQRVPLDHNGELVRMNKTWFTLEEYYDKALSEDGSWTVVQA